MSEIELLERAIQRYAERHPRPPHVNQKQAADMLGVSTRTIHNMIKAGTLKLNRCGLIPIEQIDAVLRPH
jgi:Mn-dependent DtxR family transcriptional regulator